MKNEIVVALQSSLVPDAQIVKKASILIAQISKHEGFCLTLMEIIDDSTINVYVRQAALVQLKNNIERRWQPATPIKPPKQPIIPITVGEKTKIRQYLLQAMVRCQGDSRFLKLYKNIVQTVTGYDYKQWLPINDIVAGLQSTSCNLVLHFFLAMEKSFELSLKQQRAYFDKIVIETIFPILLRIGQAALPGLNNNQPSQTIVLVCKCYWTAIHMELCDYLKINDLEWMALFKDILAYNNPQFNQKIHYKDKSCVESYYFRTKKIVTRILLKYYQKHANGKYHNSYEPYAVDWLAKYSDTFLQQFFAQLLQPNLAKTQYFMLKSFTAVAYYRPHLIDKFIVPLLFEISLPYLQMKRQDQELAKTDPLQLLRREDDYSLSLTHTKLAAVDLWISICEIPGQKPKQTQPTTTPVNNKYIIDIFKFILIKLQGNNLLEKEMVMFLLCKLRISFNRNAAIKEHLPVVIDKFIVGELTNQVLFLRARAMDVFISYGDVKFAQIDTLKKVVQSIFVALARDENTIVKVKAASAFNCILKHKEAIELVKPYLNQILEIYLKIVGKYDTEELVESLSGIVEHFSNQIGPFALQLAKHLTNLFNRYCKEDLQKIDNDDYNGELQQAACGVIVAINQIVDSKLPQQTLLALEDCVVSIVSFALTLDGCDYMNDSMALLNSYIYHLKTFSQRMWFFFPSIIYSVIGVPQKERVAIPQLVPHQTQIFQNMSKAYNSQNLQLVLPVLCNYIYKGLTTMYKQTDYYGSLLIELVFRVIQKTYRMFSQENIIDLVCCTSLMIFLLENIRPLGKSILFVWQIIKFNLQHSHSKTLRILNVQLIMTSLFNSPAQIVMLISKDNLADKIFRDLKRYHHQFEEDWQRQRTILGLSSLIVVANKPENIQSHIPNLFMLLIKLVIQSAQQRFSQHSKEGQTMCSDQHQNGFLGAQQTSVESDEFYWKEQHGNCYASRLSLYDELILFRQALRVLEQQQQPVFAELTALIQEKQKQPLNRAMQQTKKIIAVKMQQQQHLQQMQAKKQQDQQQAQQVG